MASTFEIRAPAEQTDGTRSQLLRWLKAVGDPVMQNEPLLELETDKVTVEIPAPASGILREILRQEQEEVEPGALLGRIGPAPASDARERSTPAAAPSVVPATVAAVSGPARRLAAADSIPAAPSTSPAVRRLLAEHSLDAAAVRGSGEHGRITVDDVLEHVATGPHTQTQSSPAAAAPAASGPHDSDRPSGRKVPHSAVRKRIAEHMVQSLLRTAPHVTSVFETDMTAVLAHRQRNKQAFQSEGAPLTLTAYFLAAATHAIGVVPQVNSRWTEQALEVFEHIDIGVATALDNGDLVVPVLRNVAALDLLGIARGLEDLVGRAREGRLAPADVRAGTFTISNHGVSGSLLAAPIVINQPQVAILGVGKLQKRPVVVEEDGVDRIVVRARSYVSLSIDHRALDGQQANRFLGAFVQRLESWGP